VRVSAEPPPTTAPASLIEATLLCIHRALCYPNAHKRASPSDTVRRMWTFLIKLYVFLGMLAWPAWASVAGNARWAEAAEVTVAVLVIGLVFGWFFPAPATSLAITGIAGGVVGVLVGLFYGVTNGYWVGAGMSVGFIAASAIVAAFCRMHAGQPQRRPSGLNPSGQPPETTTPVLP
jgi:hypothetical protein